MKEFLRKILGKILIKMTGGTRCSTPYIQMEEAERERLEEEKKTRFFIKYRDSLDGLATESFSSVFLLAIKDSKILAIKNDRGWDIPGGHIEKGETPEEALIREVQEEAGATFTDAKLLAVVESDHPGIYKDKVMLMYMTDKFTLGEFKESEDSFDREVIEIEEYFKRHFEKSSFEEIIYKAKDLLGKGE